MARQFGRHRGLVGTDEFIAQVDAGDTGRGKGIRLGQLLAADADRARIDLPLRDRHGLVRLGMRAQRYAGAFGKFRHARQVGFKGIEFDQQRRCRQR
ncbi:hypothetical protein D3C72_1791170 [compost metagenome]